MSFVFRRRCKIQPPGIAFLTTFDERAVRVVKFRGAVENWLTVFGEQAKRVVEHVFM